MDNCIVGTWFVWQWSKPYNFDYGTTIGCRDNDVYDGDEQVAATEVYCQQAATTTRLIRRGGL